METALCWEFKDVAGVHAFTAVPEDVDNPKYNFKTFVASHFDENVNSTFTRDRLTTSLLPLKDQADKLVNVLTWLHILLLYNCPRFNISIQSFFP